MKPSTVYPDVFVRAVDGLLSPAPREEIAITEVPAPQRLAPYAYALGAAVHRSATDCEPGGSGDRGTDEEVAAGRLILLHDPTGHEAWHGTMRLVTYVTAELEPDLAADPLLPAVAWSWLTDALSTQVAAYTALGGTVTQTASTRFGELAGPPAKADLEIRASWTPLGEELSTHLQAWYALLASTAGLPPPGVTALPGRRRPGAA